jgi:hypothetical protein
MEKRDRLRAIGFQIAVFGLLVACVSLVPQFFSRDQFPWTLLVGSFIYLHGAFMVLVFSKSKSDVKKNLGTLRFVRLGFVVVFALLVWRLFAP